MIIPRRTERYVNIMLSYANAGSSSSLRNKRPGLSERLPCKGMAIIGAARRGARRRGERTLRIPPREVIQPATPADCTSRRSSSVVRARACVRACIQAWRNALRIHL